MPPRKSPCLQRKRPQCILRLLFKDKVRTHRDHECLPGQPQGQSDRTERNDFISSDSDDRTSVVVASDCVEASCDGADLKLGLTIVVVVIVLVLVVGTICCLLVL